MPGWTREKQPLNSASDCAASLPMDAFQLSAATPYSQSTESLLSAPQRGKELTGAESLFVASRSAVSAKSLHKNQSLLTGSRMSSRKAPSFVRTKVANLRRFSGSSRGGQYGLDPDAAKTDRFFAHIAAIVPYSAVYGITCEDGERNIGSKARFAGGSGQQKQHLVLLASCAHRFIARNMLSTSAGGASHYTVELACSSSLEDHRSQEMLTERAPNWMGRSQRKRDSSALGSCTHRTSLVHDLRTYGCCAIVSATNDFRALC